MTEEQITRAIYYYELAVRQKNAAAPYYEKVNQYIRPFFTIRNKEYTKNPEINKQLKYINLYIINCTEKFVNYLMSTLLPRGEQWGRATIDEEILKSLMIDVEKGYHKAHSDNLKKNLDDGTNTTFRFLNKSNYFNEIYEAVFDSVGFGTGCFKVLERDNPVRPIIFEYVSFNEIFGVDDAFGKPNFIFRRYIDMNAETTLDLFPDAEWGDYSDELVVKRTFIEAVLPVIDDSTNKYTFLHGLYTEDFRTALFEEELPYNPYVVFRFRQQQGIFWGIGQDLKCIDDFETLVEYAEADRAQVQRVANPPMLATGNPNLYDALSLKAGILNYGGLSTPNDPDRLVVSPILSGQQLMPIENKILEIKKEIDRALFVNPLGDVTDKTMTATENQLRAQMFRKEFAGVYERTSSELLEPTFRNCFEILKKKGLIKLDDEYDTAVEIEFTNDLSQVNDKAKITSMLQFADVYGKFTGAENVATIFDPVKLKDYLIDNLKVERKPLRDDEEIEKISAQKRQAEIMLAAQRAGNAAGEPVMTQEQGAKAVGEMI